MQTRAGRCWCTARMCRSPRRALDVSFDGLAENVRGTFVSAFVARLRMSPQTGCCSRGSCPSSRLGGRRRRGLRCTWALGSCTGRRSRTGRKGPSSCRRRAPEGIPPPGSPSCRCRPRRSCIRRSGRSRDRRRECRATRSGRAAMSARTARRWRRSCSPGSSEDTAGGHRVRHRPRERPPLRSHCPRTRRKTRALQRCTNAGAGSRLEPRTLPLWPRPWAKT